MKMIKSKKISEKKFDLSQFKKLWKTKKSLEGIENKIIWQEILKEYWTRCHKAKGSITWKDIADRVFSEYCRLYYSDNKGMSKCYTCGVVAPYTELQCGHFISRGNMKYRFDIQNVRNQCFRCNCILSGNYKQYTINMIKELGIKKVEQMESDNELKNIKQYEYEEMIIERYKFIADKKENIKKKKKTGN